MVKLNKCGRMAMRKLRRDGWSLREVGEKFGMSPEGVRKATALTERYRRSQKETRGRKRLLGEKTVRDGTQCEQASRKGGSAGPRLSAQ